MKAILREAALADFERIFLWIAQDRPANARSVSERILDAIEARDAIFLGIFHGVKNLYAPPN